MGVAASGERFLSKSLLSFRLRPVAMVRRSSGQASSSILTTRNRAPQFASEVRSEFAGCAVRSRDGNESSLSWRPVATLPRSDCDATHRPNARACKAHLPARVRMTPPRRAISVSWTQPASTGWQPRLLRNAQKLDARVIAARSTERAHFEVVRV